MPNIEMFTTKLGTMYDEWMEKLWNCNEKKMSVLCCNYFVYVMHNIQNKNSNFIL